MKIAVPKETSPGETRVALAPESIKKLSAAGYRVFIERGAGEHAHFSNEAYVEAGAAVEPWSDAFLADADLVLRVGVPSIRPDRDEIGTMRKGAILLTSLMPLRNLGSVRQLAERGITAFSTDAIPRTTRAQAMDTLSSMASIMGYRGVLLGAMELPKYLPMFMTAAGTVLPARCFIIGAGVAGLQAIATAKRLGASVFATDVRPEVKEQIESVGARYVGIELTGGASAGGGYARELTDQDKARQHELLDEQCATSDIVVTTALIGGVFAPRLIGAATVRRMRPGSVIVDLAADGGGNCELSRPGTSVTEHGVRILAPLNIPASMPTHASLLWSRNVTSFVLAFTKDKALAVDFADDIQRGAIITHAGEIMHAKTKESLQAALNTH